MALRRILGQVSLMGIPRSLVSNIYHNHTKGSGYVARMGFAVTKMFRCWMTKCRKSQSPSASLDDLLIEAEGGDTVDLSVDFGGGNAC